jgi:transposase InsO family protein
MHIQKQEILEFINSHKGRDYSVKSMLKTFGVSSSSYYRWRSAARRGDLNIQKLKVNPRALTEYERTRILEVKAKNPVMRHRRITGELQKEGLFISATSVYKALKNKGAVEPYARRESPWDEPHYEVVRANVMWGADWTKLKINHTRWYLLTLIDFYSRIIVSYAIVPNVNSSHIKALYLSGLDSQNIPINWDHKPVLRTDRGSPNTSRITKKFFKDIEGDLSLARVRRPTDNAITERFYSTIKQEEIYVVESYPDHQSAIDEIGRYIKFYNNERPHQALWNYTPQFVHDTNNKTEILKMRKALKQKTLSNRKDFWKTRKND